MNYKRVQPGDRRSPMSWQERNALSDTVKGFSDLPPFPDEPASRPKFRVVNESGEAIGAGGVLGLKFDDSIHAADVKEYDFLSELGMRGEMPTWATHVLDWVVLTEDSEEDRFSACCVAGECWMRVLVRHPDHQFAQPITDETAFGETCSDSIARILYLEPEPDPPREPDPWRWARVLMNPSRPVRFEGYLINALESPAANTTTTDILTDAAISALSQTVTSPSGGFVDDLDEPGVSIEITGAGPSGATISTSGTYIDANTITIDAVAQTTVTGATVRRVRTQFTPTTANFRVFDKRDGKWFRTNNILPIENVDHSLSLNSGTFGRIESWNRDKWRVYWSSCNPAPGSVTSKSTALEAP